MKGGFSGRKAVYHIDETIKIPAAQDFRIDGGVHVINFRGKDLSLDGVVINSAMNCEYKLGIIVYGGRRAGLRISPEEFAEGEARGFALPALVLLHPRIRCFVDGAVLGSTAFVEEVFKRNRARVRVIRQIGARVSKLPEGGDLGGLRTLRDLGRVMN